MPVATPAEKQQFLQQFEASLTGLGGVHAKISASIAQKKQFSDQLLVKLRGYKSEFRIISDWGFIVDALRNNVTFQKIEEYISYAETQGLSSISENYIIKERRSYMLKYHLFAYLSSAIKNLIKRLIRN